MTTLANLADRAQLYLNDSGAGTWPQATVETWVTDGIRDYTQLFPRTRIFTINFSGADIGHEFEMLKDMLHVQTVEFPGDQDPPVYVKRLSRKNPKFWQNTGYYDVQMLNDQTEYPLIYLSEEPVDGECVHITYTTHQDVILDPGDDITVPYHHEGLIILFVLWQAFKERIATQEQDPDTSLAGNVTFLQQLVKGEAQAEAEYRRAVARALAGQSNSAVSGPWAADAHDRIY